MKNSTNTHGTRISLNFAILLTLIFGLTSQKSTANCLQLKVDSTSYSKANGTFTFYISAGKCKYDDFTLGDGKLKISMSGKINSIDTAFTAGSFASSGYKVTGTTFSSGKLTVTYKEGSSAVTMKATLKAFMVITMKVDTGKTTISWPDQKASDFERYKSSNKVDCLCSISTYNDAPLPVKLAAFDVIHVGKDRKISWVTATEINNKQFEVGQTLDGGKTWKKIATVRTKAESGNSSQLLNYELTDKQILPAGTVPFYRLRQVDYDGTEWVSWAVKPKPIGWENKPFDVSISPNPASDIVLINLETKELLFGNILEVYDALGRIVYRSVFDGKSVQVDFSNLPRGVYKIRITAGNFVKTKSIHLVDK